MHYTEEDYIYDAEIISNLIARFFEISLIPSLSMNPREDYWCHLEDTLLVKWSHVLEELLPTRDARLIGMRHYSMRQVDYIGILLRAILSVKSLILNEVRTIIKQFQMKVITLEMISFVKLIIFFAKI